MYSDIEEVSSEDEVSYVDNEEEGGTSAEKDYTILNEAKIRSRQDRDISHISSVLSVSKDEASLLLYHYNWNLEKLHEDWFTDEEAVREKVGLMIKSTNDMDCTDDNTTCQICYNELEAQKFCSLSCGHPYCVTCWKTYISMAINDSGSGCMSLKCLRFECQAAVKRGLVFSLASKEDIEKYDRYFVRSYVENKKMKTKWCPAPGCDYAVEFESGGGNAYDVTCDCSHTFCWSCLEEPHRPVNCELVAKWIQKNASEAENTLWILAYSKPCPKCKRPIEKNDGCNHMTCRAPCKYEFCWLCLGDWMSHNISYTCNRYTERADDEKKRQNAQASLLRYGHYYERWASNHKSREKAMEDLQRVQTVDLNKLSGRINTPTSQLTFIVDAWKQIIESRQVLKWTYAYGYYMVEDRSDIKSFFEFNQAEAEKPLEMLHNCAERELSPFLVEDIFESGLDFSLYRTKLVSLTKIVANHFEQLVRELENDFPEVEEFVKKKQKNKTLNKRKDLVARPRHPIRFDHLHRARLNYVPEHFVNREPLQPPTVNYVPEHLVNPDHHENWTCDQCTFSNPGSAAACAMCGDGNAY